MMNIGGTKSKAQELVGQLLRLKLLRNIVRFWRGCVDLRGSENTRGDTLTAGPPQGAIKNSRGMTLAMLVELLVFSPGAFFSAS